MNTTRTRDCPFCAHDRCVVAQVGGETGDGYTVHCPECGARGPVDTMPRAAIARWNRRGELPKYDPNGETQH